MKKIIIAVLTLLVLTSCFTLVDERKTIDVVGTANVKFQADIASFNIQVSESANTTIEASNKTNEKMDKISSILATFDIDKIETGRLSLYPSREYNRSDDTYIETQTAEHSITVWTKNIEDISKIIDSLSTITDIRINSINLDKEDKADIYAKARALAYEQAFNKAQIYAHEANLDLGSAISIKEEDHQSRYTLNYAVAEGAAMDKSTSTNYYSPECEVTTQVNVKFLLED